MTPDYYISQYRAGWWAVMKNDGREPVRLFAGPFRRKERAEELLARLVK